MRQSLPKNRLPTGVKGDQLLSAGVDGTSSGETMQSVGADGAMRLGFGETRQCKPVPLEGRAYRLLGVSQLGEINLG